MEWKAEYSVGIDTIDRQHQEILGYINRLNDALDSKDRWNVSHYLLIQVDAFIKVHFAVEEALLEIIAYPDLAAHKLGHQDIIDHIADLKLRAVKEDISGELVQFLRKWFIGHVLESDRAYGKYIAAREQGTPPSKDD